MVVLTAEGMVVRLVVDDDAWVGANDSNGASERLRRRRSTANVTD
jgi:hypothetical protein